MSLEPGSESATHKLLSSGYREMQQEGIETLAFVIRKNKSDSMLDLFCLTFNLCILLLLLQVKNIAYSLKHTGEPILKALTFNGITLFHSYRDKKL